MVAVLDQYEIEYKESYTSGTYDQVVFGKMFVETSRRGERKYVYSERGVVYGAINSEFAPQPGNSLFDKSASRSYRAQPYREKAGNCRAAKHQCTIERIYDTMPPDPLAGFRRNGADIARLTTPSRLGPGDSAGSSGVENLKNGFIMFDCAVPSANIASNLNPMVDTNWTRSYPFEPRYDGLQRKSTQQFKNSIFAKYIANFSGAQLALSASAGTTLSRKMPEGLFVGVVGREKINKNLLNGDTQLVPIWKHRWVCDMNTAITNSGGEYVTSSCSDVDMLKVLFGYGDINTIFYTASYIDSSSSNGYRMLGTNNWPDFRVNESTSNFTSLSYDFKTGSVWCTSPIIRGWKYGLHSALPDYSAAYFRQGRYGQFRDMLEQRHYTKFFNEKNSAELRRTNAAGTTSRGSTAGAGNSPVTVKFLDESGILTDPSNTQSQNLSVEATSSLPFFDLTQRNRP